MSLTPAQISDLDRLEKVIEKTKAHFLECGTALRTIKDNKLYLRDYDSFEAYCEGKWGWGASRARQLIGAANFWEAEKLLVQSGQKEETATSQATNERQIRRAKSVTTGNAGNATPSENKENLPPAKPPVPLDKEGTKIPNAALWPMWERRDEVQPHLTALSNLKSSVKKALEDSDPLYAFIGNAIIADISTLYTTLENSKLHALCTDCQGWPELRAKTGGCDTCHGIGFISKTHYTRESKPAVKEMRKRIAQAESHA